MLARLHGHSAKLQKKKTNQTNQSISTEAKSLQESKFSEADLELLLPPPSNNTSTEAQKGHGKKAGLLKEIEREVCHAEVKN